MQKILYVVTEDKYFCSHRLEVACFLQHQGYKVAVATKCNINNKYKNLIRQNNIKLFELQHLNRVSFINPAKEILAIKELYNIYKNFNPDILHHVALKPIIYGTVVANLLNIKLVINAFAGLGFLFTDINNINFKYKLKKSVFKFIIVKIFNNIFKNKNNKILLVQNKSDFNSLNKIINNNNLIVKIIKGSGIVTDKYLKIKPLDLSNKNNTIKIILAARLLWTKGIKEFVAAAEYIKNYIKKYNLTLNPEFIMYGNIDYNNPAFIKEKIINNWQDKKLITWHKYNADIVQVYNNSHIAVLPSYREGLPKSLLEAALCARAIVTTDAPGCREVVDHGVNGYLVPKEDSYALAINLLKLMQNWDLMANMGVMGRKKAIQEFSGEVIFPQIQKILQ